MSTLTELINDPTIPAHLREQIAQSQIETAQQGVELMVPAEGDLSELVGGKSRVTHEHLAGTGKMFIYDSETGEPREILQYMAAKTLMKRRNGRPAFTLTQTKAYVDGDVMCYLHPDHPNRELYYAMGLDSTKDCGYGGDRPPAAHLASEYDRDMHMERRHGREWKVITGALEEQRRQEQRDMQREQIDSMKALAAAAMGRNVPVALRQDLLDANMPPVTAANVPKRAPDEAWTEQDRKNKARFDRAALAGGLDAACVKCETLTGGPLVMHQRSHREA